MKARTTISFAVMLSASLLTAACSGADSDDASAPQTAALQSVEPEVYIVDGTERYLSSTFEHWHREADAVALVEVLAEERIEPPTDETQPQVYPVGRDATLKVHEVFWSRGGVQPPSQFVTEAMGWMRTADGNEAPMATPEGSRLEVGHRYLLALDRSGKPIRRLAKANSGGWAKLGQYASLPADGVIGVGEARGELVAQPGQRDASSDEPALALAGLTPERAGNLVAKRFAQLEHRAAASHGRT